MNNTDFKIQVPITRAYKKDGELYIEGVASSTELDSYDTIFSKNCQDGFAFDVNDASGTEDPVVLEAEHKGDEEPMNILGPVDAAVVNQSDEFQIVARLDKDNPKAIYYWNLLTNPDPKLGRPKKLGFSINGVVVDAHWENVAGVNKLVRVFDRVKLKKVGIVRAPSNPSTWVQKVARSVNWEEISMKENSMAGNEMTTELQAQEVEVREAEASVETTVETVVAEVSQEAVVEAEVTERAVEGEAEVTEQVEDVERTEEVAEEATEEVERSDEPSIKDLFDLVSRMAKSFDEIEPIIRAMMPKEEVACEAALCADCGMPVDQCECAVREMNTANMMDHVREDVSEEIEQRSDEVSEATEEVVERSEDSAEQPEAVTREQLADLILDAVNVAVEEVNRKVDELNDKLAASEAEKADLVERLAKVENQPASTPGIQLVSGAEVTRKAKTEKEKYLEEVERAKEKGDKDALIRLQILGKWNKWS